MAEGLMFGDMILIKSRYHFHISIVCFIGCYICRQTETIHGRILKITENVAHGVLHKINKIITTCKNILNMINFGN